MRAMGNITETTLDEEISKLLDSHDEDATNKRDNIQTTLDDERENIPYGDSHLTKDPDHDRWYIQNVNGINPEINWMEWRTQMKILHEAHVDGFSFTETNLVWTPEQMQKARILGRYWFKQFRLNTSSSNDPTTRKSYQPGGTCTGIMNKLAGRITKQGSDPSGLGRWTYACLEGKPLGDGSENTPRHRKINIISAYLVSQNDSSNPGHDTAFMQQK